jgi:hypothetical protein
MADFEGAIGVTHNGSSIMVLRFHEGTAQIRAGGKVPGSLELFNSTSRGVMHFEAESGIVRVGQEGTAGQIRVVDANKNRTIVLDGAKGDIILANADCAEEFEVAEDSIAEPGSVMVVGADRKVRSCDRAYDRRVAGVVSGAGSYKPGIILDRQPSVTARVPIAVIGKVFCKVDAQYGAIEVGDLLTSSPTPGHAMRIDDPTLAFGAVIGKALDAFKGGAGLIPLLVALQ